MKYCLCVCVCVYRYIRWICVCTCRHEVETDRVQCVWVASCRLYTGILYVCVCVCVCVCSSGDIGLAVLIGCRGPPYLWELSLYLLLFFPFSFFFLMKCWLSRFTCLLQCCAGGCVTQGGGVQWSCVCAVTRPQDCWHRTSFFKVFLVKSKNRIKNEEPVVAWQLQNGSSEH